MVSNYQYSHKISWRKPGNGGGGTDVPLSFPALEAIQLLASRFVGIEVDHEWRNSPNYQENLIGGMYGYATVHAKTQYSDRYDRAVAAIIDTIQAMHGSGEKDLGRIGVKDSKTYFEHLWQFAEHLRKGYPEAR